MSRFRAHGPRRFETTAPVRLLWGRPRAGGELEVPAGFRFDVSVPRCLWWIFDPRDVRFLEAAALHDYALTLGWAREAAAAPFGQALRAAGVSRAKRLAMVIGVIVWNWR